jgi:hypothetical protein
VLRKEGTKDIWMADPATVGAILSGINTLFAGLYSLSFFYKKAADGAINCGWGRVQPEPTVSMPDINREAVMSEDDHLDESVHDVLHTDDFARDLASLLRQHMK